MHHPQIVSGMSELSTEPVQESSAIIQLADMVASENSIVLSAETAPTSKVDAIPGLAEMAKELEHLQWARVCPHYLQDFVCETV